MAQILLDEPVSKYTNHKLYSVSSDFTVVDAAKAMVKSKIDSILVHEKDDIIGIVTEKDILRDVVAKGKNPEKTTLKEITHGNLITIHRDATVREAIDLMMKNDIRRLVVKNDTRPIGLISQKMICGNLNELDAPLLELEIPYSVVCSYCDSFFKNKQSLSKHIDDIHIGRGLLEGNLKRL